MCSALTRCHRSVTAHGAHTFVESYATRVPPGITTLSTWRVFPNPVGLATQASFHCTSPPRVRANMEFLRKAVV